MVAPLQASAQELAWKFATQGPVVGSPVLSGGRLFVGSADGRLYALDPRTGAKAWSFQAGGAVDSTPSVDGRRIYFLSRDGRAYAVDARTGTKVWSFESGGERAVDQWDYYQSSPVVAGDLVVFGSGDGSVYALDRRTGAKRWAFATGGAVHAEPAVWQGVVYVGSFDGFFYALREADGALLWKFDTEGDSYFPKGEVQKGALVRDGTVYFGSRDYNVYALDATTGALKWKRKEDGSWVVARPTFDAGGLFVGTSDSHAFLRLAPESGALVWRRAMPLRVFGSAASAEGRLYVGAFDGKLYAVEAASGEIQWSFAGNAGRARHDDVYDASGKFRSDLPAEPKNEAEYQARERKIMALGPILSTPALANGMVYFGSYDGGVYAVRLPSPRR
jgi:outer membrane protein assembly factor BamB